MLLRWPIEEVGLDELNLDLRNVRIPGGDLDHRQSRATWSRPRTCLGWRATSCATGTWTTKLPVVTYEDGRRIVLEGNRRITALKAIRNPSLLGKFAPRMERLLSRYPEADTPSEVRVIVAPSREAAQTLLARLHTRNPKRSWLREQQAVFYHAQLSPTVSVNNLRTLYPGQASYITSFIRIGEMRQASAGGTMRTASLRSS